MLIYFEYQTGTKYWLNIYTYIIANNYNLLMESYSFKYMININQSIYN